jgi:hypothetical protein
VVIGRRHQPKARTARANAWAAELAPTVADIRASGVTSLKGIARALNERGVPTPRGAGQFDLGRQPIVDGTTLPRPASTAGAVWAAIIRQPSPLS